MSNEKSVERFRSQMEKDAEMKRNIDNSRSSSFIRFLHGVADAVVKVVDATSRFVDSLANLFWGK